MPMATRVFRWSEIYSVNIAGLDHQHRELIDTIHELEQGLRSGEGNGTIHEILGKIVHSATAHFATEESLMEKHSFPALSSHRGQHEGFRKRIEKLIADHHASKSGVP